MTQKQLFWWTFVDVTDDRSIGFSPDFLYRVRHWAGYNFSTDVRGRRRRAEAPSVPSSTTRVTRAPPRIYESTVLSSKRQGAPDAPTSLSAAGGLCRVGSPNAILSLAFG